MILIGRTLGFYLASRFIRTISGVFLTVFLLIYTLDFVELVRRTGDVADVPTLILAQLSLLRTPAIAEQILPFAVLFGAMVSLLNLSRKLELVVARAAGVSVWQFLFPPLVVAVALGLFTTTVYNPLAAKLKEQASLLELARLGKTKSSDERDMWVRQRSLDGQAIIRAARASPTGAELGNVTVFEFDRDGRFSSRVQASKAQLGSGSWDLFDVRVTGVGIEPQDYKEYHIATSMTADQVRQSFSTGDATPFWELPALIRQTETAGLDANRYRLRFQSLLARPLLFAAMVFIAASVSLRFFRFGGVARMVLGGVASGFMLYVLTQLVENLGAAGILSAVVAAWTPAFVGSLLGTLVLLYQEDG